MANSSHQDEARRYLDGVLAAQRRRGIRPTMAKREYERTVEETARVFERLSVAADRAATQRRSKG